MVDDLGIASELDRLLPTERLRDPKTRGVRKDVSYKKKEKQKDKDGEEQTVPQGEAAPAEAPADPNSGKILDILI